MKIGIILSFNKAAGVGILIDNHNEHIRFYAADSTKIPAKGETVTFETEYRNKQQVAINLKRYQHA
ncbi:hypothetical protein [Pedobacter aquatilis]|uniref:hypothetical protein n=1 Tax=Pedobacter aquatilis TaxID=351343 RepID=UPI002931BFA3|nr:hypothetical protein [Pedobacter aquatilis]